MNIDFDKEFKAIVPCTCIDAYRLRKLSEPDCPQCNLIDDLIVLGKYIADRVESETISRCGDPWKDKYLYSAAPDKNVRRTD